MAKGLDEDEEEQYLAGNQHLVGLFKIDVEALVQKKRTSAPKLPIQIKDVDSKWRKVQRELVEWADSKLQAGRATYRNGGRSHHRQR